MEHMMDNQVHPRFRSANQELSEFLRRAEGLANGTGTVTEDDLAMVSQRLLNLAPEIGDASRGEKLNAGLQDEIGEYVKNLRALQGAVEKIRCVMLARRAQLQAAKRHTDGLEGWVDADQRTT
jgi:hypothetical protein